MIPWSERRQSQLSVLATRENNGRSFMAAKLRQTLRHWAAAPFRLPTLTAAPQGNNIIILVVVLP